MTSVLAFFRGADLASEAVGLAIAIALLLALFVALPAHAKKLARLPSGALGVHVILYAIARTLPEDGAAHRALASIALLCLLVSAARSGVLLVVEVGLGRRLLRPLPKITRDIAQGLAYAAVGLFALRAAGVEPGELLTTSALLTAVVGLSLQETLGNLFAGVAIQMQRPFDVGDWIQFDAELKHIGRVIEINWRATKVITLDEVELIIPNGTLAKAPITNFTKPTESSRRSVYVHAPFETPPSAVHTAILAAIADAPGVLRDPAPSVVTNQFFERGVEYWVRFFTDRFDKRDVVDGAVRDRIWYALSRADIPIPYPARAVELHEVSSASHAERDARRLEDRAKSLRCVDFFQVLGPGDHQALAAMTQERLFGAGEIIVREGDDDDELYIVDHGDVVVSIDRPGKGEIEVASLGPGQFFGEMALMTGDKRHATVRAKTACSLLEVPHDALRTLLEKSPVLAERISEVLAKRQAELEAQVAESQRPSAVDLGERTSQLLDKVRRFFSI